MFAFAPEVSKMLYPTNAIKNVNRSLRKIITTRGHFPHDRAATKLLALVLATSRATGRIPLRTGPPLSTSSTSCSGSVSGGRMLTVPQHPFTRLIGHSLAGPAATLAQQNCAVGSSRQQAHPPLRSRK